MIPPVKIEIPPFEVIPSVLEVIPPFTFKPELFIVIPSIIKELGMLHLKYKQ